MTCRFHLKLFALLLVFITVTALGFAAFNVPAHQGFITDTTGTLTAEEDAKLEAIANDLDKKTQAQLAVLIVPSLDGAILEDAALETYREWGIGDKKTSSGLLIFVAKDDRKLRTEVGYGLEGEIPDAFTGRVADGIILPAFKDGRVFQGIEGAMLYYHNHILEKRLGEKADGDFIAPKLAEPIAPLNDWLAVGIFLIIFILVMIFGKNVRTSSGGGGWSSGSSSGGGSSFGGGSSGGGGSSRDW